MWVVSATDILPFPYDHLEAGRRRPFREFLRGLPVGEGGISTYWQRNCCQRNGASLRRSKLTYKRAVAWAHEITARDGNAPAFAATRPRLFEFARDYSRLDCNYKPPDGRPKIIISSTTNWLDKARPAIRRGSSSRAPALDAPRGAAGLVPALRGQSAERNRHLT